MPETRIKPGKYILPIFGIAFGALVFGSLYRLNHHGEVYARAKSIAEHKIGDGKPPLTDSEKEEWYHNRGYLADDEWVEESDLEKYIQNNSN